MWVIERRAGRLRLDEGHQFDGLVVADVLDAERGVAGTGVGLAVVVIGVGRGDVVEYAHGAFGDVVDVGEVALHLAVVENVDGAAFGERAGE